MSVPTTPYRKTHVRLDPPDAVLIEPIIAQQRAATEMARGADAQVQGAWLKPQVGWQLEPIQRRAYNVQEGSNAGVLGPSDLTLPSGFSQQPAFRQATELTGVSYAAGVPASGDLFWQKSVASGDSWSSSSYVLSADQASFPAPTVGRENAPMDRVAVSTAAYAPDQTFFLRFRMPGASSAVPDRVLTFYFPGPAGAISESGTGSYAISFGGDGYAELYERNQAATWEGPDRFAYTSPHHSSLATHLVSISPTLYQLNPKLGGVIVFEFALATEPSPASTGLNRYVAPSEDARQTVRFVPASSLTSNPGFIRVDARRDLRPRFQISVAKYPASGTLQDDAFSCSFYPTAVQPFILAWFAEVPSGCSVSGVLYDADSGSPLPSAGSVDGFPAYSPVFPSRNLFAKFSFSCTGSVSPTLFGYRVQRNAVIETPSLTETDIELSTQSVAITGADLDPSHESAQLRVSDLSGALNLTGRGEHGLRIETEYDPNDSTKRAVLHRGRIVRPEAQPFGIGGGKTSFWLTSVGMWQRLAEAVSPIRFNFGLDFQASDANGIPLPFKVTDALVTLFALGGFGSASLDIPDLPMRLFSTGDPDGLMLEPQAPIGDLILRYARDYLGYQLIADPSVGGYGMWRLKPLNLSGGTAIASFVSAGAGTVPHFLGGYAAGSAFIRKGSLRVWAHPPEGNAVIAFGAANNASGSRVPQLYKQVLVNPISFDFGGSATADPTSLDYLGRFRPIYQYLPAQASADSVSWVARRIYDLSCHGYRMRSFQAPLVLVSDPSDALLSGHRSLRVNDVVTVDGVTHLVLNVNPAYARDDHQYAFYECREL